MPLVRVQARNRDAIDDIADQMIIDCFVDAESCFVFRTVTFGCFGSLAVNPEVFYPFSIHGDGSLLYSHDADEPDNAGARLNLFQGRHRALVGEYITYSEGDEAWPYRIERVTQFGDMDR